MVGRWLRLVVKEQSDDDELIDDEVWLNETVFVVREVKFGPFEEVVESEGDDES